MFFNNLIEYIQNLISDKFNKNIPSGCLIFIIFVVFFSFSLYGFITLINYLNDYPIILNSTIIFLCIGSLLFFIYLKNHNTHHYNNSNKLDYRQCILVLLAEVMRADNSLMDCEFDRVKETIRRYYTTKAEQEEALKQFEIIHTKPKYNLKNICKEIQQHYIYLEKAEIIMELLALAYSDNNLCENENCIISQIVKELGIDANQYKSIYSIFSKKYQKGFYRTENSQKNSSSTNNDQSNRNKRSNNSTGSKSNNSKKTNNSKKVKRQHSYISVSEAYAILGVESNATDEEIKKAYRAMAIKCHPDNAANLGDEAIRQATESMKQINMAWETVKMARGIK